MKQIDPERDEKHGHLTMVSNGAPTNIAGADEHAAARGILGVTTEATGTFQRLQDQRRGIKSFFLDRRVVTELQASEVEFIRDVAAYHRALFRIAVDAKLSMGQTTLNMEKMTLQETFTELEIGSRERLTSLRVCSYERSRKLIETKADNLMADMAATLDDLGKYQRYPWMTERKMIGVQREFGMFLDWTDRILAEARQLPGQQIDAQHEVARAPETPSVVNDPALWRK